MQELLPKITIITPVFNQVEYIEQTIQSVLSQGYPNLEYIIIVRFDDSGRLNAWSSSSTFKNIFEKAKPFLVSSQSQQQSHGIEQWFELPQHQTLQTKKPAFYKLVVAGVLAVYPLVLLWNLLLNPFMEGFHYLLSVLFSVIFISVLLTYPVMPLISKMLAPWLYPKPKK